MPHVPDMSEYARICSNMPEYAYGLCLNMPMLLGMHAQICHARVVKMGYFGAHFVVHVLESERSGYFKCKIKREEPPSPH